MRSGCVVAIEASAWPLVPPVLDAPHRAGTERPGVRLMQVAAPVAAPSLFGRCRVLAKVRGDSLVAERDPPMQSVVAEPITKVVPASPTREAHGFSVPGKAAAMAARSALRIESRLRGSCTAISTSIVSPSRSSRIEARSARSIASSLSSASTAT